MSLQFQYGGYTHAENEVFPKMIDARPAFTDDGVRWGTYVRYEIVGDVCADPATPLDLAGVNAKVGELELAYRDEYKDFGFLINGARSNHYIRNDDQYNLSGNRILMRSFPHRGPNELANTRSFAVTLHALYQDNYSQIVRYQERISAKGTGGKRWTMRSRFTGLPEREDIHDNTPIEIIQRGEIVGLNGNPTLPSPYWPAYEVEENRYTEIFTPRWHGHLSWNKPTHFEVRYQYHYIFDQMPTAQLFVNSRHAQPFGQPAPFGHYSPIGV